VSAIFISRAHKADENFILAVGSKPSTTFRGALADPPRPREKNVNSCHSQRAGAAYGPETGFKVTGLDGLDFLGAYHQLSSEMWYDFLRDKFKTFSVVVSEL